MTVRRAEPHTPLSASVEDYLKTIFFLERESGGATATRLADCLGVTAASVSGMARKLASRKLISHRRYQSMALTAEGERRALEVIRHHRLLESFLARALGYGIDMLHDEAETLEHAISEELEARIDSYLGSPAFDPHGSPIPDLAGRMAERHLVPLTELRQGQAASVGAILTRDPRRLAHLERIGMLPGARVVVEQHDAGGGAVRVRIPPRESEVLGEAVAGSVLVSPAGDEP